ncbi:MAG: hypothetical protein ABI137_02655 [Antricoccus sp.]
MNAEQIAELMVDLFTRLVQDGMSHHDTQTGLDPDVQDLLAVHFLKQTKDAIATLEREMLATTSLDYSALGDALGISKQAARKKVAAAHAAQTDHEARAIDRQYRPITLEWVAHHLPAVEHRVRTSIRNPRLTAVVDPFAELPERELRQDVEVVHEGRGSLRLKPID